MNVLDLGGIVIDEDTGEVLEGSSKDILNILQVRLEEAQLQEKRWGAHVHALKSAIAKKLRDDHTDSFSSEHGKTKFVRSLRRSAKAADLIQAQSVFELSFSDVRTVIVESATDLSVSALEDMVNEGFLEEEVFKALVKETPIEYIQHYPTMKTAPILERSHREDESP